jgi:hypothetical protein
VWERRWGGIKERSFFSLDGVRLPERDVQCAPHVPAFLWAHTRDHGVSGFVRPYKFGHDKWLPNYTSLSFEKFKNDI